MFNYYQIWININFLKRIDFAKLCVFVFKIFHNFKSYQNMLPFSSLIFYIISYNFLFNNIYIASHLHVIKESWTF
jgi:hypothetical protein